MKIVKLLSLILAFSVFIPCSLFAQLERVVVEKYYVSDANDLTDNTSGRVLPEGSSTYRVFIDLKPGYKLKKIYGDQNHRLKIESSAPFFNNIDRPTAYFGYLINKSWFPDNPTLALDSWLSIGQATKTNLGVLKAEDTDGSFIGGANNNGGSAGIANGLLNNADPSSGIALTSSDGLMPLNGAAGQWIDAGFRDMSGNDTTVFGAVNTGNSFISNQAFLQQNNGIAGVNPDSNKVLVAQLTTTGTLSFELNIEVIDSLGNAINYIASGQNSSAGDTLLSPQLIFPPVCGCTDPFFLEYNSNFACSNSDSCKTRIRYGCRDSAACNFDADANFDIPALCCYPGYCNDRDLEIVCPALNNNRVELASCQLSPNPANDILHVQFHSGIKGKVNYEIWNLFGQKVANGTIEVSEGMVQDNLDVNAFSKGQYLFRLMSADHYINIPFVKL